MNRERSLSSALRLAIVVTLLLVVGILVVTGAASARRDGSSPPAQRQAAEPSDVQPRTISYTYDDARRLIGVDYGDGMGIAYEYDESGNLLEQQMFGFPTPVPEVRRVYLPTLTKGQ